MAAIWADGRRADRAYQATHAPLEAPKRFLEDPACAHVGEVHRHIFCAMTRALDEGVGNISRALGEPPRYRWHLGCILLKMPAISLRAGLEEFEALPPELQPFLRHVCVELEDTLQPGVVERAAAALATLQRGFAREPDPAANAGVVVEIKPVEPRL